MNQPDIFDITIIKNPSNYDAIEVNAHNETTNEVITTKAGIVEALEREESVSYNIALHFVDGGIETIWMTPDEEESLCVAYEISQKFENLSKISVNIEKTEADTDFIHTYIYHDEDDSQEERETFIDATPKEEFESFQMSSLSVYFSVVDTTVEPYAIWSE